MIGLRHGQLLVGIALGRGAGRSVGFEVGVVGVGGDEPDFAVVEVGEELGVLLGIKFACPEDFGVIDFGAVVDPFVVNVVVVFVVADNDQVLAGRVLEFFGDGRAAGIALAGPPERIADAAKGVNP